LTKVQDGGQEFMLRVRVRIGVEIGLVFRQKEATRPGLFLIDLHLVGVKFERFRHVQACQTYVKLNVLMLRTP